MLFKTLVKLIENKVDLGHLSEKIDVFYAVGKLTTEEYKALRDMLAE